MWVRGLGGIWKQGLGLTSQVDGGSVSLIPQGGSFYSSQLAVALGLWDPVLSGKGFCT